MNAALTLYQIEEDLQALLDTQDMVPAEQLAEFERELLEAIETSVVKRQRCAEFLFFCSQMQANCDGEIDRLARLKQSYEKAAERMEGYIVRVIESLGPDAKGKYPKLVGRTATLGVCRNPEASMFRMNR